MARRLALAVVGLALAAGLRGALQAQTKRVSLAISLSGPASSDGGRKPQVRLLNLLADRRWAQALGVRRAGHVHFKSPSIQPPPTTRALSRMAGLNRA